jgi:hypothetical protein
VQSNIRVATSGRFCFPFLLAAARWVCAAWSGLDALAGSLGCLKPWEKLAELSRRLMAKATLPNSLSLGMRDAADKA